MKHFINWKKRYQDLYRRHEKLAVTMTLNLSIAQDKINNHIDQGRALLLANEALQSEVQDLLAKIDHLEQVIDAQAQQTITVTCPLHTNWRRN